MLRALELALQHFPTLERVIAGKGPAGSPLKCETAKPGLDAKVDFVGYLDTKDELLACYAAADAFDCASRTETQGLVLLEAMAVGLPVISTAVMGTRNTAGPRCAALVPDDDERAYARERHSDALGRRMAAVYAEVRAAGPGARR